MGKRHIWNGDIWRKNTHGVGINTERGYIRRNELGIYREGTYIEKGHI